MRYFVDTEHDDGGAWPVLISIAVVADDGREYYGESEEFDESTAKPWVAAHVLPHLGAASDRKPLTVIRDEVAAFFLPGATEVWGMVPGYDWVLFHRLFGQWERVPPNIPWHCWDLAQWRMQLGDPPITEPDPATVHHALVDARWARRVHQELDEVARASAGGLAWAPDD